MKFMIKKLTERSSILNFLAIFAGLTVARVIVNAARDAWNIDEIFMVSVYKKPSCIGRVVPKKAKLENSKHPFGVKPINEEGENIAKNAPEETQREFFIKRGNVIKRIGVGGRLVVADEFKILAEKAEKTLEVLSDKTDDRGNYIINEERDKILGVKEGDFTKIFKFNFVFRLYLFSFPMIKTVYGVKNPVKLSMITSAAACVAFTLLPVKHPKLAKTIAASTFCLIVPEILNKILQSDKANGR